MVARILIAYFSMTGPTRPIAKEIARATGADIEEIREPRRREGLAGIGSALVDALLRRSPEITKPIHDPAIYDVVIVGGPIWAGKLACPVRRYARDHARRARQVAFFCTAGGPKADGAFADLQRLCKHAPRATCLVDANHLEPEAHRAAIAHLIAHSARATQTEQTAPNASSLACP